MATRKLFDLGGSRAQRVSTLQAAGYHVRAIANPLQDLTTDAAYVADYLKTIPGPVVLAGHSYGGGDHQRRGQAGQCQGAGLR
jgi:pimeloyl-ACP methyl ester carboxylesterase